MRRFAGHLFRFSLLPAALLALGQSVLIGSGEAWSIDRVVAFQQAHPGSIFLRAIDQAFYAVKYRAVTVKRPAVLVAGSSRTMKFRAGMFGDRAGSFFNAGGMVNSLDDLYTFAFTVPPPQRPDVLILGIDLWWLNEHVEPLYHLEDEIADAGSWHFDDQVLGLRWLALRPLTWAAQLGSLVARRQPEAVGLAARAGRGGFRPDGSFQSALAVPRPGEPWTFTDREEPPIVDRVRAGTANFVPTAHVSAERLAILESVLDRYQSQGLLVVGYLPPFSSAVASALTSDPRYAAFFQEFRRTVPAAFAARGFSVVDLSEATAADMDDRAMSDGFHGEETIHARAVRLMVQNPRVAAALPGARAAVDRALASPRTNYWYVDLTP